MAKRLAARLVVTKVFDWDKAQEAWDWRIVVPRRFTIGSAAHYTTQAGARAAGRAVAAELGLALGEGAKR